MLFLKYPLFRFRLSALRVSAYVCAVWLRVCGCECVRLHAYD